MLLNSFQNYCDTQRTQKLLKAKQEMERHFLSEEHLRTLSEGESP